jgi:hypothetical protein
MKVKNKKSKKMKDLFKVTVKVSETEKVELLFDDQDRAERFVNATTQIMTEKGKKEVEFITELECLIDSDEDIIKAFGNLKN